MPLSEQRSSLSKFAPLFIILASSLWGVDGIVLRPALFTLPVPLVVFIESTIVAVLLTPFFIRRFDELKKLTYMDWLAFLGVALAGGAIGVMAITKALFYVNYVNLSVVVLIQKLQPVFAIFLAAVFLKERLPKTFFIWAGMALAGAYLMTFGFALPQWTQGDKTTAAALLSLLAAFSFGSSTVLSKRALKHVEFKMGTYLRFLISSGVMLLIVSGAGEISHINDVSNKQMLIFLLIAFSTGGPAIFLYYYGLRRITASVSTICELAFPLTAVLLEYLLRGNMLGPVQWLGVFILFAGIIKVSRLQNAS